MARHDFQPPTFFDSPHKNDENEKCEPFVRYRIREDKYSGRLFDFHCAHRAAIVPSVNNVQQFRLSLPLGFLAFFSIDVFMCSNCSEIYFPFFLTDQRQQKVIKEKTRFSQQSEKSFEKKVRTRPHFD